jgi:Flp pilus assembly protein TadD
MKWFSRINRLLSGSRQASYGTVKAAHFQQKWSCGFACENALLGEQDRFPGGKPVPTFPESGLAMSRKIVFAAAAGIALTGCASIGGAQKQTAQAEGNRADGTQAAAKAPATRKADWQTEASVAAKIAPKDGAKESKPKKASKAEVKAAAKIDAAARIAAGREDVLTQMTFWAGEHERFPDDVEAAVSFIDILRVAGRAERAVDVGNDALSRMPASKPVMRAYGLALIAAGRSEDALRPLTVVTQADPKDWRTRSSLGVALDEQGRFDEARQLYKEALAIQPAEPGVLTNLGVSYLMEGKPADAETILKQAAALPGAGPEARQNLAMAVGLQGRFTEAEQLLKVDLPPAVVANNLSYMRGLIMDDRRWGDMKTSKQ